MNIFDFFVTLLKKHLGMGPISLIIAEKTRFEGKEKKTLVIRIDKELASKFFFANEKQFLKNLHVAREHLGNCPVIVEIDTLVTSWDIDDIGKTTLLGGRIVGMMPEETS